MIWLFRVVVAGFLGLLVENARAAEHDWPAPPRGEDEEEQVSLLLSQRAGIAEAPFVTTPFPEVSGFAVVFTAAAGVQISPLGWLGVRWPVSVARLDFPAGAQVSETAVGNLELGLEHEFTLQPATRWALRGALVAPTAERGPEAALLDNRALALGNALNGGLDSALLTPGVSGLRLGASLEHWHHPFGFRATFDLPLLVRISDAGLPEETETHPVGLLPAIDLEAAWWMTPGFGASLGGALIVELSRVQEPALESDRERRLQAVVEPALHGRVGRHVALGLSGSLPVGGNFGGDAWSVGVYGRLEE